MKTRPIIFSGPMVQALLEGRKTQTRRIYPGIHAGIPNEAYHAMLGISSSDLKAIKCPYGQPGDLLWVRETWADGYTWGGGYTWRGEFQCIFYRADAGCFLRVPDGVEEAGHERSRPPDDIKWKPSIHMVREDSRLTLRITDVRVERLQAITEAAAEKEGMEKHSHGPQPSFKEVSTNKLIGGTWKDYTSPDGPIGFTFARDSFQSLWDSLNEKRGLGWDVNPWVWVLTFEVVHSNVMTITGEMR